jgi:hypothetical protein
MNNILFKLKKARQADDLQAVDRYEYELFCYRLDNIKKGDRVILRQIDNPTHEECDEVIKVHAPHPYHGDSFVVELKNNGRDWTNFFRIIKFVEE